MWYWRFAPLAFGAVVVSAGVGAAAVWSSPAAAQESQLDGLRAAVKDRPTDPAAALGLGRALRRADRLSEALAALGRGVATAPSGSDVLRRLRWEQARVQMDKHDLPRAMAACRALGSLRGAAADGHACTADAYLLWQRATEALTETAAALAKDPNCYEADVAQGRAYELSLEPSQAELAYRAAVALRPAGAPPGQDAVDAHVGLGRVLLRQGRRDEGLAELRQAVQMDPDGPVALFELGTALAPSDESVSLLDHATHERRTFPQAWLALGEQQLAAGRLDQARDAAAAAVRDDPQSVAARVLAGKVALAEGHADESLADGQAAMNIVANDAAAVLLVADSYAHKGDIDSALEAYQSAWGLDHRNPGSLVRAAQACHAAARDTSARAFAAKAVEEFPNYAPAWTALGDALVAQNEVVAARDAYRKALSVTDGTVDRASVQAKLSALK